MKEDKRKYITTKDKIIGFFNPTYLSRRKEYVQQQLEAEGWPRLITISEAEKRMGITRKVNDLDHLF